jgi:endonuclease I/chitodextrinase
MKQFYLLLSFLITAFSYAQLTPPTELQAYYNGVDFTKTQLDLFNDLAVVTAVNHTNSLSYTPGIWEASKMTDEDTDNSNNVRLFYGYSDTDNNHVTDRTRNKNLNGGNSGTDWNREHVFPNSLANPNLDSSGSSGPPYADGHNLRPSDVQMNSNRGNKKFAAGSGNAGNTSSGSSLWYPGDEYKGDAARIIMYMYTRYGSQCHPSFAVQGTTNSIDPNMINLLLEWNAEDPVSLIEDNRNTYHANTSNTYAQGNRNPFIDNPYLATVIWGGTPAENRWGSQPPTDTQAPSTPLNLVANNPTETTVDLNWTASTDDTGVNTYDVYVDGAYFTNTGSDATTFTVTGLSPETSYTFTILAKDAAGNQSNLSATATETTLAGTPTDNNCPSEDFENIPANQGSYATRVWTGNDGITDGWTATDARTDQQLNSRAICIRNGSLTSPALPGGIGNLTVTTQLTFGGSAGNFDVLVNGTSVGTIPYTGDNTVATTTSINNINIVDNITVELINQSSSNRVRIDDLSWTCFTLSTTDFNKQEIKIYPNPIKSSLLTIEVNENSSFEIYDILGKKILKGNVTSKNNKVSLSSLSKGVYILRLQNKNGSITKKLIKE